MANEKMKAARFYGKNKPLVIEEIDVPKPGLDEVRIKVNACGICGSDIHIIFENADTGFIPITLGHEPAGIIDAVGNNVFKNKIGDRVIVSSGVYCGECENCLNGRESICFYKKHLGIQLNGGLAEYMIAPSKNVINLPDSISFEQGALFPDAIGTPYHAITKRGKLKIGETIAIFGCGGLGFHAVQIAKICGATTIIAVDISDFALQRAQKFGATNIINPEKEDAVDKILNITERFGVDMVLECVGNQETIALGVESLKMGGRIVVLGLSPQNINILPPDIFVRKEFSLIGSSSCERSELMEIIKLVEHNKFNLEESISAKFKLADVNTALEQLKNRQNNPVRIIIKPA
jgi:alcohol dehydrogenase, propanol-preferring